MIGSKTIDIGQTFEQYASMQKLYIVGGEPIRDQESLERLVASGKSKDIQLEYNSNQQWFNRLVHRGNNLKNSGVSIDGIEMYLII